MRIGIFFSSNKNNGGVYQYGLSFLDAIGEIEGHKFIIFNDSGGSLIKYESNFEVVDLNINRKEDRGGIIKNIIRFGYRAAAQFGFGFIIDKLGFLVSKTLLTLIKKQKIDIMIFLSHTYASNFLSIPIVNVIYDLQHRINPRFPEVSKKGIYQMREYFYRRITDSSTRILVDSEVGKQDVIKFYNFPSNKIVVLPFLPPNYLLERITDEEAKKILSIYKLSENFLFYPAQFWPHKNHLNILKAINKLKTSGIIVSAVFCGTKKEEWGILKKMEKYIEENDLSDQIFYLGYVDNKTMSALYHCAEAMIMPTFFGPTNIPVLEAWKMGCPVIYSDISGCREQLGNAGLLINPNDFEDIANKIALIWKNEPLRHELVVRGTKKLKEWTYIDFSNKIKDMINELISQTYGTQNN